MKFPLGQRRRKELDEELESHLQMAIRDRIERGESPEDAATNARREFGNAGVVREVTRDAWGWRWLENILRDLRYGTRILRQNPGFTAVAILTMALGIGANTAIFSVVYAALLRPLPYYQPAEIATLGETRDQTHLPDSSFANTSYPDYIDWTQRAKSFDSMGGYQGDQFIYSGSGNPETLQGGQITASFFSTLGVKMALGRDFLPGEDVPNAPKIAIVSHVFWEQRLGGNPSVVGQALRLDSQAYTLVGVLPENFDFAPVSSPPIWVPINPTNGLERRNLRWLDIIARFKAGVSPAQAYSEMKTINSQLAAAYPQQNASVAIVMGTLRDRIVGKVQPLLLTLLGAVSFVLLIACANVASLFLARVADRRKEIAVRVALGAGRKALVRQFLTESLVIAFAGGGLGLLWSQWGVKLMLAIIPKDELDAMPYLKAAQIDPAVLAFTVFAAVITGILFGVVPAIQMSRTDVNQGLRDEGRGASAGAEKSRLRDMLVVSEIALALVLLAGAGLMVKSVIALMHQDPGFSTQNLLTFAVGLPDNTYKDDPSALRFERAFSDKLRNLPGVQDAAVVNILPLSGNGSTVRFVVEGRPIAQGHEDECNIREASANYFQVMRVPLIEGRYAGATDVADKPPVVIVNKAFATAYFPNEDPVGKRFRFTYSDKQPFREIVGVVGNENEGQLDEPVAPTLYLPFEQSTESYMNFAVRTKTEPAALIPSVREALREMDREVPLIAPKTMDQIVAESPAVFLRKFPSVLIGSFAGLAMLLAMVGLYGLVSYSVSRRTREIGIRIALGAQSADVFRMILTRGLQLAALGVLLGLAAAAALTQLLSSLLFGVHPIDAITFLCAGLALGLVATFACLIPGRRATNVDPMVALRYE
jgi:putative ABC transport system permease protein